ncbi:hypothetical protein LSAT2_009866 [Lamellibrachia satsuma]|nr:hypothetical protein LSAT2_009866 [Lamellibrachia satsuma]
MQAHALRGAPACLQAITSHATAATSTHRVWLAGSSSTTGHVLWNQHVWDDNLKRCNFESTTCPDPNFK